MPRAGTAAATPRAGTKRANLAAEMLRDAGTSAQSQVPLLRPPDVVVVCLTLCFPPTHCSSQPCPTVKPVLGVYSPRGLWGVDNHFTGHVCLVRAPTRSRSRSTRLLSHRWRASSWIHHRPLPASPTCSTTDPSALPALQAVICAALLVPPAVLPPRSAASSRGAWCLGSASCPAAARHLFIGSTSIRV